MGRVVPLTILPNSPIIRKSREAGPSCDQFPRAWGEKTTQGSGGRYILPRHVCSAFLAAGRASSCLLPLTLNHQPRYSHSALAWDIPNCLLLSHLI